MYNHTPVLLQEVLVHLSPAINQNFVDGTLGGGGYTQALLEATAPDGKVLAFDLDQTAIDNARKNLAGFADRLTIDHKNFSELEKSIQQHDFTSIDGIVADIGISSAQLEQSDRGISFQSDSHLDMRFDLSSSQPDASFLVNNHSLDQLTDVFRKYGEEKYSRQIAKQIVATRADSQITRTTQLNQAIEDALPKPVKHLWKQSARRIYQALRIEVNHELQNLERFLPAALNAVKPGGRIVLVTFHSLEDRIVKQFFRSVAQGCVCPPEFPICKCGNNPQAKILTKKPVTPSEAERASNPRSQSAKLRAIKKL